AGSDLLSLINDILDLSKIESGMMAVDVDEVTVPSLTEFVERTFRQQANAKGLEFSVDVGQGMPQQIYTDPRRLQQVLKNLLANAFKFTDRGRVALKMDVATSGWSIDIASLNKADMVVAFSVVDTGIGIPLHKQKIIFEAFQQADGTTSRKYGGTGLGLSISREIAKLLGGEISVVSSPGKGSTFTLYIPHTFLPANVAGGVVPGSASGAGLPPGIRTAPPISAPAGAAGQGLSVHAQGPAYGATIFRGDEPYPSEMGEIAMEATVEADPAALAVSEVNDDRNDIQTGDKVLLIIEDDVDFARILLDMAREKGFKGIVALRGDTGLALARRFKPDAITLDITLPIIDGWTVLDRLKHDPKTRHIPVHLISAADEAKARGLRQGALAFLKKPVTRDALSEALQSVRGFIERRVKNLLVVEDDETQRHSIVALIGNGDVQTTAVATGEEAIAALKEQHFDCMVLDLGLPDMPGLTLIETIKKDLGLETLPIVVYTGRDLTPEEEIELKRGTEAIIVKSVRSMEHLLDETALFLHRVEANLPQQKRQMLTQAQQADPIFAGKKVLVIDDDIRNIFAITSVLERHKMDVCYAENGRKGIEVLKSTPGIDAVLMDVMMPEMDGYETTREIRSIPRFISLPIIALTAKAMKGDREKCIEAGASEYIPKPVDPDQLMSLLRVWLYKQRR
ncbi:MAG: response regulator, partial [Polyangiaceae bacterium]|nr:response regulator [Polyangiaceae bacterium]